MSFQSRRMVASRAAAALRPRRLGQPSLAFPTIAAFSAPLSAAFHSTPLGASDAEGPKTKQPKVKKKTKKTAKDKGGDRQLDLIIGALDAPVSEPPPASDEEMARRHAVGRAYNIGTSERLNELNHDLNCKMKMKQLAVDMLPKDSMWREEALRIDDLDGPPMWRHVPVWTAPIPGFNPSQFNTDDE